MSRRSGRWRQFGILAWVAIVIVVYAARFGRTVWIDLEDHLQSTAARSQQAQWP